MKFDIHNYSEKGPRLTNQDFCDYKNLGQDFLVACIADGVGGKSCGDIASKIAVDNFINSVKNEIDFQLFDNTLKQITYNAHKKILDEAQDHPNCNGMATTFSGCFIQNNILKGIHTGDTRICILRGNGIKQLTVDHTEVNRLYKEGKILYEDMEFYPRKHILESALGIKNNDVKLNLFSFNLMPGDRLILTSDGVHDKISKKEFRDISVASKTSYDFVTNVVSLLLKKGPTDNYTIISITII